MNEYDYRSFKVLKKFKVVPLVKSALVVKDSGIKGLRKKIKNRNEWKKNSKIDSTIYKNIDFKVGAIDIVVDSNYNINDISKQLKESNLKYNMFYLTDTPTEKEDYKEISTLFFKQYFWFRAFVFITNSDVDKDDFYNCIKLNDCEKLVEKIEKLADNIKTLKVFSNYNNKDNITVKAATFFNYVGTNYYSGGAERYLVDLYEVCKRLGYNLDIYQNAEKPYMRKFNNINVIGLSTPKFPLNYSSNYIKEQAKNYFCAARYFSQLHIYSAFYECYPYAVSPSIGISHGVAWDNTGCKKTDAQDFWNRNERIIEGACMCDKMISVDTNTANWFQTIDYELGNQRIKVIPNYVDTEEFKESKEKKNKDKIVITYPRRLYEPRGMYLLLDIVDDLFKKYKNLEIHFVGKGFDEDVKKIEAKIKKYPNRLFCYSQTPDKMHEVYKKSDISLVPTLYSEGTSLSCLEAMSTGNIVIATRIGGLSDMIINGYNGYLIEPTKESLLSTIEHVIDNYDDQSVIRKRARESALVFNKNRWMDSWAKEISEFDLKGKSETIDLVEFYVEDIDKLSNETFRKIKEELQKNQLIYIRSYVEQKNDVISSGLLQLVPFDEEIASVAKKVYVEKTIKDMVSREENIEII